MTKVILNLVDKERSAIDYKVRHFPDGQHQIALTPITFPENTVVTIYARLTNFFDLEIIICATQALRSLGVREVELYVPYFLGARSDRQFQVGEANYLKTVICPIINLQGYSKVITVDPHSNCLEMGLVNFEAVSNKFLVEFALNEITAHCTKPLPVFISPDAGAATKIYKLIEDLELTPTAEVVVCSKRRDINGKVVGSIVPMPERLANRTTIVVDDLCDGGATFIGIEDELAELYPKRDVESYLVVTHGIFSKGFDELATNYNKIFCTNSYVDYSGTRALKDYPDVLHTINVY